jgi:hypothetical protein
VSLGGDYGAVPQIEEDPTASGTPDSAEKTQAAPPHQAGSAQQPPGDTIGPEPETAPEEDPAGEDTSDSQEEAQIRELKQRDAEVKAHEQAHMAAGGGLVQGAASYTYEKGPDGSMYAVGGEVKIDTSPARTPEQTIRKAQQIRRAALAPAQPSGTDRAVAAAASQMEAQARAEKTREEADGEETAPPEAVGEAASKVADETEAGPRSEASDQNASRNPFAAPPIQAYQSAAAAAAAAVAGARAISTFA